VNYAKLLEMNSFFSLHSFLEVGKTQDLPSKFWQTLGDALRYFKSSVDGSTRNAVGFVANVRACCHTSAYD
jgi:hypothetical protein